MMQASPSVAVRGDVVVPRMHNKEVAFEYLMQLARLQATMCVRSVGNLSFIYLACNPLCSAVPLDAPACS